MIYTPKCVKLIVLQIPMSDQLSTRWKKVLCEKIGGVGLTPLGQRLVNSRVIIWRFTVLLRDLEAFRVTSRYLPFVFTNLLTNNLLSRFPIRTAGWHTLTHLFYFDNTLNTNRNVVYCCGAVCGIGLFCHNSHGVLCCIFIIYDYFIVVGKQSVDERPKKQRTFAK